MIEMKFNQGQLRRVRSRWPGKGVNNIETKTSDWDTLPEIHDVPTMAKFLNIGKAKGYELVAIKGFPSIRLGRVIRVSKSGLRAWIEKAQKVG